MCQKLKYDGNKYECEILVIRYIRPTRNEEFGEPDPDEEIVACVSGDVDAKIKAWAEKSRYKVIGWENPYQAVHFIELLL
jgi:hypothetical protein